METIEVARGRPPEGPSLADRLEGPEEPKKRLKAILETIAGERTIDEVCRGLGIGPARFHELRTEALQAALESLAPRPAGRPPREVEASDPRIAELEAKNKELDLELRASHVREQLALNLPQVLKKTKSSKVLEKIQQGKKKRR